MKTGKRLLAGILIVLMAASCCSAAFAVDASGLKTAYKAKINEFEYCYYSVYDIDIDGTPELIIDYGQQHGGQPGRIYHFFTYTNKIVALGTVAGYHGQLYPLKGKNGVYLQRAFMGEVYTSIVSVKNGKVIETEDAAHSGSWNVNTAAEMKKTELGNPLAAAYCTETSLLDKIQIEDEKGKLFGLITCGEKGNSQADGQGALNAAALYYSQILNNRLSGYTTERANIKKLYYNARESTVTPERFKAAIKQAYQNTKENDISFFTYNGHDAHNGGTNNEGGIWLAAGAEVFGWQDLARYLSENIKGKIVVFYDSCYAGRFIRKGVETLSKADRNRFTVIAACGEDQFCNGNDMLFHPLGEDPVIPTAKEYYTYMSYYLGVGTGAFNGKLRADSDSDYQITAGELFTYIRKNVKKAVKKAKIDQDVTTFGEEGTTLFQCDFQVRLSKSIYEFDGKEKNPKVVVTASNGKTVNKNSYTVQYTNNREIGVATATVKIKGKNGETRSLNYLILPQKVSGLKVSGTTGSKTQLRWNSVSDATGYIVYRYNPSTKAYAIIKVTAANRCKLKGLNPGTTYRFAVRAYKTVNGENFYGKYSSAKKVTTKNG